ncbi:hypothetical protein QTP86_021708 [Hemibagrus guttatus]|nr:hypothetical protein QTP86_021708 [Hemibagrus guttatus]
MSRGRPAGQVFSILLQISEDGHALDSLRVFDAKHIKPLYRRWEADDGGKRCTRILDFMETLMVPAPATFLSALLD